MLKQIEGQQVCLTFDDGPDPRHTPRILDILAQYGCRASFFVLGEAAERWPGLIRRLVKEGHSLGCHSLSHPWGWSMTPRQAQFEVHTAHRLLEEITGNPPRWFRPPYGKLHPSMLDESLRLGMATVLWSRSAIDWGPLGSTRGIARRLRRIAAGDIVLLHDGKRQYNHPDATAAVLPDILAELRRRGLTPLSLDQAVIDRSAQSV